MNVSARVLRYLTERPGSVVYRDEITDALDLSPKQVTYAVRQFQQTSPIGPEIITITQGNAWRYAPKVEGSRSSKLNGSAKARLEVGVPMTHVIRDYFMSRPNEIVHLDEIITYVGEHTDKVRAGINNARQRAPLSTHLETVQAGRSYRYSPPRSVPTPVAVSTAPQPQPQLYAEPVVAVATIPPSDEPRIFEEVGIAGGGTAIIIRDPDGNMFRATPMQ